MSTLSLVKVEWCEMTSPWSTLPTFNRSPLKNWRLEDDPFLLGMELFTGKLAVKLWAGSGLYGPGNFTILNESPFNWLHQLFLLNQPTNSGFCFHSSSTGVSNQSWYFIPAKRLEHLDFQFATQFGAKIGASKQKNMTHTRYLNSLKTLAKISNWIGGVGASAYFRYIPKILFILGCC